MSPPKKQQAGSEDRNQATVREKTSESRGGLVAAE